MNFLYVKFPPQEVARKFYNSPPPPPHTHTSLRKFPDPPLVILHSCVNSKSSAYEVEGRTLVSVYFNLGASKIKVRQVPQTFPTLFHAFLILHRIYFKLHSDLWYNSRNKISNKVSSEQQTDEETIGNTIPIEKSGVETDENASINPDK